MTLPLHGKQRSWQVVITQKNMATLPGTDEAIQHKRANEENLILDCFFFLNNSPLSRCWRATGSIFGGNISEESSLERDLYLSPTSHNMFGSLKALKCDFLLVTAVISEPLQFQRCCVPHL